MGPFRNDVITNPFSSNVRILFEISMEFFVSLASPKKISDEFAKKFKPWLEEQFRRIRNLVQKEECLNDIISESAQNFFHENSFQSFERFAANVLIRIKLLRSFFFKCFQLSQRIYTTRPSTHLDSFIAPSHDLSSADVSDRCRHLAPL